MLDFEDKRVSVGLLIVISLLGIVNLDKDFVGLSVLGLSLEETNFDIEDNVINLNSLTLRHKIGQMLFTLAKPGNKELYQKMNIGGIYFWQKETAGAYKNEIDAFQRNSQIPFLTGIDLEGCWNPFDNFHKFPAFNEIESDEDAFRIGSEQGRLLTELGFNINFSRYTFA